MVAHILGKNKQRIGKKARIMGQELSLFVSTLEKRFRYHENEGYRASV
jgi:hypothetical protein